MAAYSVPHPGALRWWAFAGRTAAPGAPFLAGRYDGLSSLKGRRMPHVSEILKKKGTHVLSVGPQATVLDAVTLMNDHKVGALLVQDQGRAVGIFTERDLLRRVVGQGRDPKTTRVADVMTADVISCTPGCDIDEARAIFMQRRIRHLPIVDDDGQLRGMVSIGDLNAWMLDGQECEIRYLHEYIYGRG